MTKLILFGLLALSMFNVAAHAGQSKAAPGSTGHKEEIGFGLGALIGGLVAGPPGAVIGAAGGTLFGNKEKKKALKLSGLEQRLTEKQTELTYLQTRFAAVQAEHEQELQKVKLQKQSSALTELSQGISLTVYFRTNNAVIDKDVASHIQQLASFLKDVPEIQLHLEAHADRRGPDSYNRDLSQHRAAAVRQALLDAGIDNQRIHPHAYGETQARAANGDMEGHVYDRRVDIVLTLDTHT